MWHAVPYRLCLLRLCLLADCRSSCRSNCRSKYRSNYRSNCRSNCRSNYHSTCSYLTPALVRDADHLGTLVLHLLLCNSHTWLSQIISITSNYSREVWTPIPLPNLPAPPCHKLHLKWPERQEIKKGSGSPKTHNASQNTWIPLPSAHSELESGARSVVAKRTSYNTHSSRHPPSFNVPISDQPFACRSAVDPIIPFSTALVSPVTSRSSTWRGPEKSRALNPTTTWTQHNSAIAEV